LQQSFVRREGLETAITVSPIPLALVRREGLETAVTVSPTPLALVRREGLETAITVSLIPVALVYREGLETAITVSPIPVAARHRAWVCGSSLVANAGESRRKNACLSLTSVVCCQVEVSATGRSLVQRIPTEFV